MEHWNRAILLLTETQQERKCRENKEAAEAKLATRSQYLDKEVMRFKKDPGKYNRQNSAIFGTKVGLSKDGMSIYFKLIFSNEIQYKSHFIIRHRV